MRISSTRVGEARASLCHSPARCHRVPRLRNALREARRRLRLAFHTTRLAIGYAREMRRTADRTEWPDLARIYRAAAVSVVTRLPQSRADIHRLHARVVALEAELREAR